MKKENLIYNKATRKIILYLLNNDYPSIMEIAKKRDITNSQCNKIILELVKLNYVIQEQKDGRTSMLRLTKKGLKVASLLSELRRL